MSFIVMGLAQLISVESIWGTQPFGLRRELSRTLTLTEAPVVGLMASPVGVRFHPHLQRSLRQRLRSRENPLPLGTGSRQ
ncbi:MAG: hypothetical protein LDL41_01330 [Coleofasciculus sp. S288]|nr:hypothetical protein [Coleofasciculus sp. S288]